MAPALTEPLSSADNLNNSTVTTSNSPIAKNTRKINSSIVNKTGINSKTKILTIKSATPVREKRCRSTVIAVNQTPTSSKRVTRSWDNIQRNSLAQNTSINRDNISEVQQTAATRRTSKVAIVHDGDIPVNNSLNNKSTVTKNEQMGLNTALLNNKNKIFNNINKNTNTSPKFTNIEDNTKDPSTEKLLADLTNEAITAEICLRNQLKDVNLVKTSGDPSSPIIQQQGFVNTDTETVVLKVSPRINKTTSAHMEAQFNEIKSSNFLDSSSSKKVEETISPAKKSFPKKEDNDGYKKEECQKKEAIVEDKYHYDGNVHESEKSFETDTIQNYVETAAVHKISETSSHLFDDVSETKKSLSKLEILSVQALPPVSTDSTMTASEVEDNLEERLSQLDGTAIDSPPPTNHDIDSNQKNSQNSVSDATPPRTPSNQQMLSNDLQELQEQLQQTPPTPVAQPNQSNHLELQQQQPQQTHCFTTPQTTASINLLGNVGNVSQPFTKEQPADNVGSATDLEDQDIEEVFKVLKGFEGGTTSELNVCDLNVLFNEVYMKINETEISGNAGSGGIIANGISSTAQNVTTVANPSIQLVKPTEVEEGQIAMEKRQQQMQRKIDFLMRRLRKLQARYMCKHTSEEIAGLFEWAARQTSKGVTNSGSLQHCESPIAQDSSRSFLKVIAARPPASDWKDIHETLVPANQVSTFLRKIESVANAQQLCTVPSANLLNITHKKSKKALLEAQASATAVASNSSVIGASISNEGKAEEVVIATLDENVTDELSQVTGLLQIELSEVQKSIDSDATESSSGGESADEMVTYNNTQQQSLPITKRAAWRYSRDRAAIASRWSWLLSQISDLEIKIRQHSDLHQEIIRSKGPVTCDRQVDEKCTTEEKDNEDLNGSCRTRGYIPSLFRKRKLIQTTNIHTISKKAARPSTIKCGCQWPLNPCALCTGRSDPTAPRDLPDTMMMSDRIALLDSGYHPVLSFRENVNNALHFEAIAKQPEWQQRVMRCQAKSIAKNIWKAEREAIAAAGGQHTSLKKYNEAHLTKRRYIKKKDKQNIDEKTGGKTSSTKSSQLYNAATFTSASSVPSINTPLASTTSLNDMGNGTANLSNSSSTTPLVANRGMAKSARKQYCSVVKDEFLRDSSNTLLPPKCTNNTTFPAAIYSPARTTSISSNKKYIHQTSDCLPINYDQFNPKQVHSSLISNNHHHNNNNSKSNKHRKLSSSTVINSHHYNHHNNNSSNLYNGDSNYMFSNEYWGGGAGDNFSVRSRTSSPTHGNSSNIHHKYERLLDRKNRTSYDIDNIVIPYSVAAATRVELLPYKEIPTPKWRVIENEEVINNLPISEKHDFEIDTPLGAILLKNGYVSDESINTNSIFSGNKKENSTVAVVEESYEETLKSNNTKESDIRIEKTVEEIVVNLKGYSKESNSCLATTISPSINNKNFEWIGKENIKFYSSSDDNETDKRFDKITMEPENKKIKIESNDRTESSEGGTEKENDEAKLIQESVLKEESIDEDEDISDEAMFLRHERALTEERRKFQTYLKFPWSTRSRANRRIDSRAESSGANTPDPSSPAPQTPSVGGGDLESIPSPSNPPTPLNSLDTISEAGDNSTSFLGINSLPSLSSKRYERRRTTSTKRDREVERRSSTPDSKELIAPYEPLTFPLSDEQFEELMRAMPIDHGEDSKRFDDCYLPGNSGIGVIGTGGFSSSKYPRTVCSSISKRSSRASTLCGDVIATTSSGGVGGRRIRSSNFKNVRPISADDSPIDDMLLYDDDYEDDYPKHHLAPNDNHLATESVGVGKVTASDGHYIDDDDDVYGDQYDAYVGRKQHKRCGDSEDDSSEEEPFQDDDPNDPEWRGETEERLRKKV